MRKPALATTAHCATQKVYDRAASLSVTLTVLAVLPSPKSLPSPEIRTRSREVRAAAVASSRVATSGKEIVCQGSGLLA